MTVRRQGEWEQRLRAAGAVYERPGGLDDPRAPHVGPRLSGHHTSVYLNSARIIRHPRVVRELVENIWVPALAARDVRPDRIVGYAPYTNDIALALASAMDVEYAWAGRGSKTDSAGNNIFETDFLDGTEGGNAVLLADDLVSGGSLRRTAAALALRNVEVVGPVLCIGNMSGEEYLDGREIVSAATFDPDPEMFTVRECGLRGLCYIGSTAIANPRNPENWAILQQHTAPM